MAQENGGTIEDQRDQLVQQLSALTNVSVTQSSDGEVISTGNGTPLVMGGQSFALQTTTGTGGFQQVLDSNGNNITSTIQGGQLGGAIQLRDQVIPGFLTSLNNLASQFAASVNAAQAKGYDSYRRRRPGLLHHSCQRVGRRRHNRCSDQRLANRRQLGWHRRQQWQRRQSSCSG